MSMTNREAVEILRAEQWAVLEDVEYGDKKHRLYKLELAEALGKAIIALGGEPHTYQ